MGCDGTRAQCGCVCLDSGQKGAEQDRQPDMRRDGCALVSAGRHGALPFAGKSDGEDSLLHPNHLGGKVTRGGRGQWRRLWLAMFCRRGLTTAIPQPSLHEPSAARHRAFYSGGGLPCHQRRALHQQDEQQQKNLAGTLHEQATVEPARWIASPITKPSIHDRIPPACVELET